MRRESRGDSSRLRLGILGVVVLSLFATMLARLWYLQVLVAPELAVEAQANSVRLVYTEAPRGRILDRQGLVLVDNRVSSAVVVDREAPEDHPDLLPRLATYLGVPVAELERRLEDVRYSQYKPVPVADDVPKEKVVYLREHHSEFPGVDVVQITQRAYPNGGLASHVLGYVGEINDRELAPRRSQGYREGDTIGKSGVELAYESALRGTPQVEKLQVDSRDRVLRSLGKQPAVPGRDVLLTLDLNLQRLTEESLEQGLDVAHKAWDKEQLKFYLAPAGSAVVLDPRDGAVLAMASWPTYDPVDFVNGISTARFAQLNDPTGHYPLNNRAIQGLYAPGSTFKTITALAALDQEVVTPGTTINDTGRYVVTGEGPDENRTFSNAFGTAFGPVNLGKALTVSSDVYFYRLGEQFWDGRRKWGNPIQQTARSMGLGQPTEIELPFEAAGRVPDPDSRKKLHESNPEAWPTADWYTGDSVNLSVGQGELVVTPLQLANAYAAFANGGTVWATHIGRVIRDVVGGNETPLPSHQLGKVDLPADSRDAILGGLRRVVSDASGTAFPAFVGFPLGRFPLAGKTGTAEVFGKQDTALFVGFGPADDARYVAAVVMEEAGLGASAAAPVVRRIFDGIIGNPIQPVARIDGRD